MEDDVNLDMSKTYIYEGQEYILTGRIAKKTEEPAPPARRSTRSGRTINNPPTLRKPPDIVVEIKPAPRNSATPNFGASFSGVQWVKYKDLHMVEDILKEDDEDEDS